MLQIFFLIQIFYSDLSEKHSMRQQQEFVLSATFLNIFSSLKQDSPK